MRAALNTWNIPTHNIQERKVHLFMWINFYTYSAYPKELDAHVSPWMCTHTSWYEWSLISDMSVVVCVCVSVSEYVPRPRRFPLSCILKFALRLFHRTAALSSKARSRLLLPFLSRPIFLLLSVSLFSLHISLAVMLMFLLLFSWGNIHGVAPGYASQTSLPCKHLHTLDILQISVT